ncbi:subtilisin family serine protease [Bradyrhizobium japonicum]|uniref:S8 family peptidase n=1 Tax=Bradyrhizobium liaoningense TaxID=43992 RepID=UPI001BA5F960|nr:S8 family serine peptidase [Bradyrhizobium liaoningense]MBR1070771.1 S8 family serine peptidase [Bradyrhizobium liaoningense]
MAENSIELTYGGKKLSFEKSENLIAVKPRPGMEAQINNALAQVPTRTPIESFKLNGFKVIGLNATPLETDQHLNTLRLDPAVAVGTHVFHTSDDGVPFVPTGTVFVAFKNGTPEAAKEKLIEDHKLQIVESRDQDELLVKVTSESENPIKTAASLQKSALVEIAEPELATPGSLKAFVPPSDLFLADQWHLKNTGNHRGTTVGFKAGADARVLDAWTTAETMGDPMVVLAVIDDGFDLAHPDLSAPGKIVHPWDFTRNTNSPTPDANSQDWHGTACAGVATGRAAGGNILGAAPAVTLMPVRWGPSLSDTQIENWFKYVAERGAWVVSCSWGALANNFPLSTRASRAISKCVAQGRSGKGSVVVFAAGNSNHDVNDPNGGTVDGFAIHPDVIAVSASTSKDQRSHYSNFGAEVWICAPSSGSGGWGILTSDVTGSITTAGITIPLGYDLGDYTADFGGTSSACPLVAGICALLLSVNPDLRAVDVRNVLRDTARKIGEPTDYQNGHSRQFGYGCVDANAAVRAALQSLGAPLNVALNNAAE